MSWRTSLARPNVGENADAALREFQTDDRAVRERFCGVEVWDRPRLGGECWCVGGEGERVRGGEGGEGGGGVHEPDLIVSEA